MKIVFTSSHEICFKENTQKKLYSKFLGVKGLFCRFI